MKEIYKNWTDFKQKVTERVIRPQFDIAPDCNGINIVIIYGKDGYILFVANLTEGTADY